MVSRLRRSSVLSLAPVAPPAVLEAAAGLSVATTQGATSEGGGSRRVLACRAARRLLWRCSVAVGRREGSEGMVTEEEVVERRGCRTQLSSAWLRLPIVVHPYQRHPFSLSPSCK